MSAARHEQLSAWIVALGMLGLGCMGTIMDADGQQGSGSGVPTDNTIAGRDRTARPDDGSKVPSPGSGPPPAGAVETGPRFGAPLSFLTTRNEGAVPLAVMLRVDDSWTFGDIETTRIEWSVEGQPVARGFLTAQVFERPGTYRVSVAATRGGRTVASGTVQIVAHEWSGKTIYVAGPEGNDGDPGTEEAPLATAQRAFQLAFGADGPTRVLFRRGQRFDVMRSVGVSRRGPYRIGAYGQGAAPTLVAAGGTMLEGSASDVAVTDIAFDSGGRTNSIGVGLIGNDVLVLRSTFNGFNVGVLNARPDRSGSFIIDSTFTDTGSYGVYSGGRNWAIVNTTFDEIRQEHMLRLPHVKNGLITGCTLRGGRPGKHQVKIHAEEIDVSERLLVSDNVFENPAGVDWIFSLGPQDNGSREKVREVIIERNTWRGAPPRVQIALQSRGADEVVVRHNLFLRVNVAIGLGDPVSGYSTWNGWRVYHNSHLANEGEAAFWDNEAPGISRVQIRNNLSVAPQAPSYVTPLALRNLAMDEIEESHNTFHYPASSGWAAIDRKSTPLSAWQASGKGQSSSGDDPLFVNLSGADLHLQASSGSRDSALELEAAFEDRAAVLRPSGRQPDRGAFEH